MNPSSFDKFTRFAEEIVAQISHKKKKTELLATPCNSKAGWFNMHYNLRESTQKTSPSMIINGDFFATALRRYT